METAHIIDEGMGGSNDASNGIPVCLDCHQEIGAYDDKHPKGNKIRTRELVARRDRIYHLVETGLVYAQLIAERARLAAHGGTKPAVANTPSHPKASLEARRFLEVLLSPDTSLDAPARKLSLLNAQDRAYVLDALLRRASSDARPIIVLGDMLQSRAFPPAQAVLIAEQLVRAVTLYGDVTLKAELLRTVPEAVLAGVYHGLRIAFFEDLIGIVNRDQFAEVNKIVPPLVQQVDAIPEELYKEYVFALLEQARSDSYNGAPAARRALSALPESVAEAGIRAMNVEFLDWNSRHDAVKEFVRRYRNLGAPKQKNLLRDLVKLTHRDFIKKHIRV